MARSGLGFFGKLIVLAVVVLGVLGALRWYLLQRTGGDETMRVGIETAVAKLEADLKIVSARASSVSESAGRDAKRTVEVVAELMGDADLNRLALSYLGADWSIPRGAFLGSVREIRKLQRMRADERVKRAAELKDARARLERRRRNILAHAKTERNRHKFVLELAEVEAQMDELRNSQDYLELVATDGLASKNSDAKIVAETTVGKLAEDYRKASVVRLTAVITDRLEEQKKALAPHDRLRALSDRLDFWPLNALIRQPK